MGSAVVGCGIGMPEGVLENSELAHRLGIEESWILERTGIRSRRIAGPTQNTVTLASEACLAALHDAGRAAGDIDTIIVATSTLDDRLPAAAPQVQEAIGARQACAFDVNAGCAGFVYALAVADSMIRAALSRTILVCGSDVLARYVDEAEPKSSVLFGDGAGAIVLDTVEGHNRLGPFKLRSDGSGAALLGIPASSGLIKMNGREVYRWAVEKMSFSVQEVLTEAGLRAADVALLVGHQANERILSSVAERVGMMDRSVVNIHTWGNTSAASIPIALAEASLSGAVQDDDIVVLTAFGSGFVWGSGILRWGSGTNPLLRKPAKQVAVA